MHYNGLFVESMLCASYIEVVGVKVKHEVADQHQQEARHEGVPDIVAVLVAQHQCHLAGE